MSSAFIKEANDSNFESVVINSSVPVLVDFWAPWCGPCRALAPTVEAIAEESNGGLIVCKVNVDESPEVSAKYGIRGIPTLIYFKGGEAVNQVTGNVPKAKIVEMIS